MKNLREKIKRHWPTGLAIVAVIAFLLPSNPISNWVIFFCAFIIFAVEVKRKYFKTAKQEYEEY